MRIEELHIDRFGAFQEKRMGPFSQGVNIVEGPNEAGKSTLLTFIRYTLFGYPRYKNKAFRTEKGDLAGGRVTGVLSDEQRLTFERQEGSKGGPQKLYYADDSISEDPSLWSISLGNADDALFENIYAFTIEELTDPGLFSKQGLFERILSAGYGMGGLNPEDIRKRIGERAEAHYKKRGSTAHFNTLKERIDQKRQEIAARETEQERYAPLMEELREAEAKKAELEEKESHERRELDRLKKALDLYSEFRRFREAEEELARIGDPPPIDQEGGDRMEELAREREGVEKELQRIRDEVRKYDRRLAELEVDEEVLGKGAKIRELSEERGLIASRLEERDEAFREKEAADRRFDERCRDLGYEGGAEDIRQWEGVEQKEEEVRSFQKKFEELLERERDLDRSLIEDRGGGPFSAGQALWVLAAACFIAAFLLFSFQLAIPGLLMLLIGGGLLGWGWSLKRSQGRERSEVGKRREELAERRSKLEKEWEEWLGKMGFSGILGCEAALDRLRSISELQRLLREKDEAARKLEQLQEKLRDMQERVEEVWGGKLREDELSTKLRELSDRLEAAKKADQERKDLQERRKEVMEQGERKNKEKEELDGKIQALLEKVGVEELDAFREKARLRKAYDEAWEKKRSALDHIEDSMGKGASDELIALLRQKEKAELEREKREREESLGTLAEEKEGSVERLTSLRNEQAELEKKADPASLRNEEEALWAQMRESYLEWMSQRLALKVFDRVRERYEREQQPALIQEASRYFERFTKGRYPRIRMPLGSDEDRQVRVFDREERPHELSTLSRGTREQLLLAVRLGFIEEYEKHREPLPLVMDEVLVNFDQERAKATAEVLKSFTEERQLILFTCHPWTKELFGEDEVSVMGV